MSAPNIPGYEVVAKLHEGGTATSWKANSAALNRSVILKTLDPEDFLDAPEDLARIIGLMRKVAALRHEGIAQVLDHGEHRGLFYFVTEDLRGTALSELLLHKPLSPDRVMEVAQAVARAMEYAWREAGLVHGNLKPRTILREENDSIVVLELGLTRRGEISDPDTNETRTIMLGTPNYMSPEQVSGRVDLDCRSDIYSLGATLYHAASGRMPFHDTPGEKAMGRQLRDVILSPRAVNPKVPSGLCYLVSAMMVKNRDERYADWSAVIHDLKRVKAGRIFVHRESGLERSTVAPPVPSKAERARGASRGAGERSGVYLLLRVLKWAAILALWFQVGRVLFRLPPA